MRLRTSLFLALALGLLRGDSPPQTQLVDLSVIAVDSNGRPVTDLTRDDFQVTDAGKPQPIVFFRHNDAKLWQAPMLQPNEFWNRRGANIPRATVVLFDLMNQNFATRGVATNQLTHYLEALESADYLYLYFLTIDGRIYSVHGLPDAQTQATPSEQAPWTKDAKQIIDQATREVTRVRPTFMDVALRVQLTYRAIEGLASELARIPGRKNIVWITDGVPIELGPRRSDTGDFVDFTPLLRQLSAALDRSGIAIYPVRQVMIGSPDAVSDAPGGGGANGNPGSGIGSIDTLDQFAGMTGGRPDSGKDIGAAIKQALSDSRTSYSIGYYPPPRNWDGKYHKLRVTCSRKGVRIQSKTGYYAWPEPPGTRAEQAVRMAAATTFDAAEIGVRAAVAAVSNPPHTAHIEAHIDANDVAFVRDGDQYSGQLRLTVISYLTGGLAEVSPLTSVDLHYNEQQRQQAARDGIPFMENIPMPDNVRKFRLVVFDRGSDSVGSVSLPVSKTP